MTTLSMNDSNNNNPDPLALMVNQLWRAKWLLGIVFITSLACIFAASLLLPERIGVRMVFVAPSEAGSRDLLSAPLLDRSGEEAFVQDTTDLYQRFFAAIQSATVKKQLFHDFVARQQELGLDREVSFQNFIESIEITLPEISERQPLTAASEVVIRIWGESEDVALWLASHFEQLAHEHAMQTLRADFSAAQRFARSGFSQSTEKMREDYAFESRQEIAQLEERLVLLQLSRDVSAGSSTDQRSSELSLILDSKKLDKDLPVYLLSDKTLSSAIDTTSKRLSQIRSRQNPDLFIEGIANNLSRIIALENVVLQENSVIFFSASLQPTVDESLRSPKRFLLSIIGAVLLTIFTMVTVLLAPLVQSKQ